MRVKVNRFSKLSLALVAAFSLLATLCLNFTNVPPANAATIDLFTASSPGFEVNTFDHNTTVSVSGSVRNGEWTGGAATTPGQLAPRGTINAQVEGNMGTDCDQNDCPYGAGFGYKAMMQFRFDPANWYEIGILNEGFVTYGPQIVVRGTDKGNMFQTITPLVTMAQQVNNASIVEKMRDGTHLDIDQQHFVRSHRHLIKAQWTRNFIMFVVDNTRIFGKYKFAWPTNGVQVSFQGAGKHPGNAINAKFTNINYTAGGVTGRAVFIPDGKPYASISADMMSNGWGTGFSAYIKFHDGYGSAISGGIQTALTAHETWGRPYLISGRMQDGIFDYDYIQPADYRTHNVRVEWWKDSGWVVIWLDGKPVANMRAHLRGRLYASVEGNAAHNGDVVHAYFDHVEARVGHKETRDCGFFPLWDSVKNYGINTVWDGKGHFEIHGTAQGVPAGKDWDTTLVGAVVMTWQYQPGEKADANAKCMKES